MGGSWGCAQVRTLLNAGPDPSLKEGPAGKLCTLHSVTKVRRDVQRGLLTQRHLHHAFVHPTDDCPGADLEFERAATPENTAGKARKTETGMERKREAEGRAH